MQDRLPFPLSKIRFSQIFVNQREIMTGFVAGQSRIDTGEMATGRGFQDRPIAMHGIFETS